MAKVKSSGNSLASKILARSKLKNGSILTNATLINNTVFYPTNIPILNVALSGRIDGGLSGGMTQIAGPSKHFKSSFALVMAKAFQDKNPDGVILFMDNEFGTKQGYFRQHGLDTDRVIHQPFMNIQELKTECVGQLHSLEDADKLMIVVDSIGNAASLREVNNALSENEAVDMSRPKDLKAFGRIVTPYLKQKDVPMVIINHTYQSQGFISTDVVGGGQGLYLSSDTIMIIGRAQDKQSDELVGWNFKINIEKSRFCREKSKFEVNVRWETGVSTYSGLADIAVELGVFTEEKVGKSSAYEWNGHKIKAKDIILSSSKPFWDEVFTNSDLIKKISEHFLVIKDVVEEDQIEEVEESD